MPAPTTTLLVCTVMKIVIKKGALRRLGSAKVQLSPRGEISGVPVSYRDNNGVYSAVQQITELRQTVGRVYQHQGRSPRLRVNASLTLHLCTAAFGEWPTVISFYPASSLTAQSPPSFLPPLQHLLIISISPLPSYLPNSSSSLCCTPRRYPSSSPARVCVSSPSL